MSVASRLVGTLLAVVGLIVTIALPSSAYAHPPEPPTATQTWLLDRVKDKGVLVIHVLVPLCNNAQIVCGSKAAGDPVDLKHNLYWGAIFGQKRFFSRKASNFEQVSVAAGVGAHLERAVFRRQLEGASWDRKDPVELIVVLDAFRGDRIDDVVDSFFDEAGSGKTLVFGAKSGPRSVRVDVVGYAGHNRMMDGKRAPAITKESKRDPIPSFVMACHSRRYFSEGLTLRGSDMLVMTKQLMAPEGYVIEAIVGAVAINARPVSIKARAVAAYAKWQKTKENVASTIFD